MWTSRWTPSFQSSSMKDSYATDANAMSIISSREVTSRMDTSFSARNAARSIPYLVELSLTTPTLRFSRSLSLYFFFTSNRGLSVPDLANSIDVSVKTARRYLRKFRILMDESNNEKKLESMFYEADIIEVGGRYPGGKRGKGSENKQKVLMVLSTGEDNKHPRYMKLHVLSGHKSSPVRNFMFKHVLMDKDSKLTTDNDTFFMWMKDYVNLENSRVNYQDRNHKMKWLNIVASNFVNNIKNIYKCVCKRETYHYFRLSKSTGSTTDIQEDTSCRR